MNIMSFQPPHVSDDDAENRSESDDNAGKSRWRRLGYALLWFSAIAPAIAVFCVVVALCMLAADWWPWEDNSDNALTFVSAIFAAYALLPAAAVWVVGAIVKLSGAGRWMRARWFLLAPTIGVLGLALAVALRILVPQDFADSRDELTEFAQHAQATGSEEYEFFDPPRTVGHVEVNAVRIRDDGAVEIKDADGSGFFTDHFWIYSTGGPPKLSQSEEDLTHLGGPWYSVSRTW